MIQNLFLSYKTEANPEHWEGFPETMWNLGFEMDCYQSAPTHTIPANKTYTEREQQDHLLSQMDAWETQDVGNYIFSRYRELTHWSDYGYPEERGHYFFVRAFPILESKLVADWDKRNTIPSLKEFSKLVASRLVRLRDNENSLDIHAFVFSDEGQFYIKEKYNEYSTKQESKEISTPMFRGKCVTEAAYYMLELY